MTWIDPESGKTFLHNFAAANEEEAFFQLIQKAKEMNSLKSLIEAENRLQDSILYSTENRRILKCLIENDIDLRKKEKGTQKTLLYIFSKNNELEFVKLFCEKLKENYPNDYFSVINQLIKSSQIDRTSQESRVKTALIIATEKNNYDVVRALVEAGIDFRTAVDGISPINYAPTTLWRDHSYQILKQAWCGNMQRKLDDWEKLNALSHCGVFRDFEAAKKLLLNKVLPFPISDIRDEKGNGLLMSVLIEKNLSWEEAHELVLLILGKYPDQANQPNHAGDTPLMYALNNPATVDILLQAKADPNKRNKQGKTALHIAKNKDTIAALIKGGADPYMKRELRGVTRISRSGEVLPK